MKSQRSGNSHTLTLAARQLVRIIPHALRQSHLFQKTDSAGLNLFKNLFLAGCKIRLFLCQKLSRQHYIFQGRILGKQVKGLKHQTKMQPLLADLRLLTGSRIACIKQGFSIHTDDPAIWLLQKIQTPQQGGFSASRGTDDRQHLSLFQSKINILQHFRIFKRFADILYFQDWHCTRPPLPEIIQLLFQPG